MDGGEDVRSFSQEEDLLGTKRTFPDHKAPYCRKREGRQTSSTPLNMVIGAPEPSLCEL